MKLLLAAGGCASGGEARDVELRQSTLTVSDLIYLLLDAPVHANSTGAMLEKIGVSGVEGESNRVRTKPFSTQDAYRVAEVSMRRRLPDDTLPVFFKISLERAPCLSSDDLADSLKLYERGSEQTLVYGPGVEHASISSHPYAAGVYGRNSIKVFYDEASCVISVNIIPDQGGTLR